ncbi:uncharacterized protein [Diadema setosum]|uniref:uncharacterized protein n=1 Tax=Diadema setosum TaxID=31175 RepID=UPI003B3AA70D
METSRTRMRREVREKRLAYFDKVQGAQLPRPPESAVPGTPSIYLQKSMRGSANDASSKSPYSAILAEGDGDLRSQACSGAGSRRLTKRPSSAKPKIRNSVQHYSSSPLRDDASMSVSTVKGERPFSAKHSMANGRQHQENFGAGGSPLRNPIRGKTQTRPSSAKVNREGGRGQDARSRHVRWMSSASSNEYKDKLEQRSANLQMASSRRSEFGDFRIGASGDWASGSRQDPSVDDLENFFQQREIRQRSRYGKVDMSAGMSGDGELDHVSATGNNQNILTGDFIGDNPYGYRSKNSLEGDASGKKWTRWTPEPTSEAVKASEFHSVYSAENMLQSLLGIRKVKASVHDELLTSFLEHGNVHSVLRNQRKTHPQPDIGSKEGVSMASSGDAVGGASIEYSEIQQDVEHTLFGTPSLKEEEPPSAKDGPKIETMHQGIGSAGDAMGATAHAGEGAEIPAPSEKDEGEESGVEMDDLQFDVGALCSAAKQGDDVLRQYIRGLTQKIRDKKEKDTTHGESVTSDGKKNITRETLFTPKLPERRFDDGLTQKHFIVLEESTESQEKEMPEYDNEQCAENISQHSSSTKHLVSESSSIGVNNSTLEVDAGLSINKEQMYQDEKEIASPVESSTESEANGNNHGCSLVASEPRTAEDVEKDIGEKILGLQEGPQLEEGEAARGEEPSPLAATNQECVDVDATPLNSNKTESPQSLLGKVQPQMQEKAGSEISRIRQPAVTADFLAELGLCDYDGNELGNDLLLPPPLNSLGGVTQTSHQKEKSDLHRLGNADSSNDDIQVSFAASKGSTSDLGLETFRPEERSFSPLKVVRNYMEPKLCSSPGAEPNMSSANHVGESSKDTFRVQTATLRRTYDLSDSGDAKDLVDPNINTPLHSNIQKSKNAISFVFDMKADRSIVPTGSGDNGIPSFDQETQRHDGKHSGGVAFEVDLALSRKQPKPPPSSKPINSRALAASRSSPKHSINSPKCTKPKRSPRTTEAHVEEIRQHHEKERRLRKSLSPRASAGTSKDPTVCSSNGGFQGVHDTDAVQNSQSLRLSLGSNMDTERPSQEDVGDLDLHDSIPEVEYGAPFVHSPRQVSQLDDEDAVLDRIASFDPLRTPGENGGDGRRGSEEEALENEGIPIETLDDGIHQDQSKLSFQEPVLHSHSPSESALMPRKPRPSSANPKKSASQKMTASQRRPQSALTKMYWSPDKSYDRKWPQSSMAWMTQQKLASGIRGHGDPAGEVSASGSKVRKSQARVNREFARKEKPPLQVPMSKRDGQFIRVRSSRMFDGTVAKVLGGRGSSSVPPLTLQLIQDSPRGSESLSIWQLLPDEILLHIFSHLPQPHLTTCALVCHRFQRIAMDDSLWKTISLENRDLTDFYLTMIGERHPARLTIHKCRGTLVTENGLRNLFRSCADSLLELNFTGCSGGALQGDSVLLHASRCFNLQAIDASWCAVSDNGLSAILDGCPRLESICLNGCQLVTDQCLRQIIDKYGPNLRVLELCGCFNLSAETLVHLADTSSQLTTLNIAQCYKITDDCIATVATKLPSLRHWYLKGCKELRDSAVRKIARHCKKLETLAVASCPHVTDASLIEIATYMSGIRNLDVSGCRRVGNEGVRSLATCCPFLERLGLSSTSITHKSVSSLASYSCKTLEELKINCCREITEASIIRLLKHCKGLKTLHLYGVKGLRNLGVLKVQYPCIEYQDKASR